MRIKLILAAALIAFAGAIGHASAQTGTPKSAAVLNAEVNSLWPDQNSGGITPFNARQTLLDIIASMALPYTATTWTPTLQGSSGAGAPTYTIQVGSYEQIGRQVTIRFTITTTALGGPTGNMQIGGLPVTSANVANDSGFCSIVYWPQVTLDAGFTNIVADIAPNTNVIRLFEIGSAQNSTALSVAKFAAATTLGGFCSYHS